MVNNGIHTFAYNNINLFVRFLLVHRTLPNTATLESCIYFLSFALFCESDGACQVPAPDEMSNRKIDAMMLIGNTAMNVLRKYTAKLK